MNPKAHKKIHKVLRKYTPHGVRRAKKIFSFRYPKLFFLIALILFAYFLFSNSFFAKTIDALNLDNNLGIFISGALIAFGFTAPFGIGLLIRMAPENIFLASIIGGLGATLADLLIFRTIRFSFLDEFKRLEKTKMVKKIEEVIKNNKHILIKHYLLYIFAGIVIATPLPDELGVSMLAGLTTIKPSILAMISFILHSVALFLIFYFV